MHSEDFFFQAFVYLTAAVLAVPVAKRLGLGSVLGYLIAGVIIGPFALGLVGSEGQDVMHFAEFGVVMMLFLVGLELEPSLLWRMRAPIVGLGGLQVTVTAAVLAGGALALGVEWKMALAVGLILALSSTAIVLQTLAEKGLMKTGGGQSSFAVLLFQDVSVIPMLALLPLLAVADLVSHDEAAHGHNWVDGLPGWAHTLVVLAAVAVIIIGGRFVMRPAFRFIARTRQREVFVAAALLLIIGIALLMTKVGLSPALGTFVAGVVLANSEYRHELESDIEPFKGLLLGVFFIAVGASIDFGLVAREPATIAGLVAGLIVVKGVVLFALGRFFKLPLDQNLIFSFALAQGGEFAFVLFSFVTSAGVLPTTMTAPLIVVVAISMALTPLLFIVCERILLPKMGTREANKKPADAIDEANQVIIAGYGRFGQIVGRLLAANGKTATVLDVDSEQVELLRKFDHKVFYGDAARIDLLHTAGAHEAKVFVIATDDHEKNLQLALAVREHFPNLQVLARARGRREAFELHEAGVEHIYRETFDTALRAGVEALRTLGFRAYRAQRAGRIFLRHDEAHFRETAAIRGDREAILNLTRERNRDLEAILRADQADEQLGEEEAGWDVAKLRNLANPPGN